MNFLCDLLKINNPAAVSAEACLLKKSLLMVKGGRKHECSDQGLPDGKEFQKVR